MSVAIVGAGIIGLYLAWKLAELGHQVTVFERKKKLGGKVCSGLISERLNSFIPLDQSVIENKIRFCQIRFPNKTVVLRFQPIHLVVNRQKLSEQLFQLCQRAGAEIRFGQEVKEISAFLPGFDRIIGCDGALSVIREQSGLAKPCLRLGLQVFEEREDYSDYVETWPVKQGFCWRIPRGERIEYGGLGGLKTIKEELTKCLQKQKIALPQEITFSAALVPQGLCLPDSQRLTLCGDAAGLTKPWSGGGVIWGLEAADILLKTFPDFSRYRRGVWKLFGPRILKARITIPLVYFLGNYLPFLLPSKMTIDNDSLT